VHAALGQLVERAVGDAPEERVGERPPDERVVEVGLVVGRRDDQRDRERPAGD